MKRVVYVNATDELGGADSSLFELVRCLDRSRFEPHVVLPHRGHFAPRYEALHVPVHVVPLQKMKNTWDPRWHASWFLRAPLRIHRMARLLRRLAPDIVHVNSSVEWLAGLAARRHCDRTRASLVWHVREMDLKPAWMERIVFRAVTRLADSVITISNPLAERLTGGAPVRVVHNGIDLQRFQRSNTSPVPQTIAWVGRLVPWKGLQNVLQVFERVAFLLPQARLLVHGIKVPGHEAHAEFLKRQVQESTQAARVRWHDGGGPPDRVLSEASLFLHLPSLSEGFGRTVVEAQAAGVPVVSWPHGGLAEVVDADRSGILVPVGDLDAAVTAVVTLLTDERRRSRMGHAAALFAAGFSNQRTADSVQDIYELAVR